jgi:hypothetical protein
LGQSAPILQPKHEPLSLTAYHLRQKCSRRNFEFTAAWLQAVRDEIFSVLLPWLEPLGPRVEVSLAQSFKFLTPDLFKMELAVEERIDAMIDRATKRLIQTKAMKQMLPRSSSGGDDHLPKIQNGQSNGSARAVAPQKPPRRIAFWATSRASIECQTDPLRSIGSDPASCLPDLGPSPASASRRSALNQIEIENARPKKLQAEQRDLEGAAKDVGPVRCKVFRTCRR